MLRSKLTATASCPVVCGRAPLSALGVRVPSSSLARMPQKTNKSRDAPLADSPGSVQAGAAAAAAEASRGEDQAEGGDDNVGDSEIIKSPSDPKQYR